MLMPCRLIGDEAFLLLRLAYLLFMQIRELFLVSPDQRYLRGYEIPGHRTCTGSCL